MQTKRPPTLFIVAGFGMMCVALGAIAFVMPAKPLVAGPFGEFTPQFIMLAAGVLLLGGIVIAMKATPLKKSDNAITQAKLHATAIIAGSMCEAGSIVGLMGTMSGWTSKTEALLPIGGAALAIFLVLLPRFAHALNSAEGA